MADIIPLCEESHSEVICAREERHTWPFYYRLLTHIPITVNSRKISIFPFTSNSGERVTMTRGKVTQDMFNQTPLCRLGGEIFFPAQFDNCVFPILYRSKANLDSISAEVHRVA